MILPSGDDEDVFNPFSHDNISACCSLKNIAFISELEIYSTIFLHFYHFLQWIYYLIILHIYIFYIIANRYFSSVLLKGSKATHANFEVNRNIVKLKLHYFYFFFLVFVLEDTFHFSPHLGSNVSTVFSKSRRNSFIQLCCWKLWAKKTEKISFCILWDCS